MVSKCTECTHYHPRSNLLSFDVEGRLGNHHPFVKSEAEQLSQLMKDAEKDIRGYNTRISWLRQRAAALELERKAFQERLDTVKSLLSPIRRLPLELLVEIFSHCCANTAIRCDLAVDMAEIEVPAIVLGQVCRAWHKITASHASLWATLELNVGAEADIPSSNKLRTATERLLKASGNHPLDVKIIVEDSLHASVLLVLAECRRWIRVSFSFGDPVPFLNNDGQLKSLRGNLPMLEQLEIIAPSDINEETNLFSEAPRLRSASIGLLNPSQVSIPWAQIHTLTCVYGYFSEAAYGLHVAKQLKCLELTAFQMDTEKTWPPEHPVTSHIEQLRLHFRDSDTEDIEKMMLTSTFHNLSSVILHRLPPEEEELEATEPSFLLGSALLSLFTPCSKSLTDLRLDDLFVEEEDFLIALGVLTHLHSLSIRDSHQTPYFTDNASRRLLGHGNGIARRLLPELQRIHIDLAFGRGLAFSHCAELIMSRCTPVRTYNAVTCCALENVTFAIRNSSLPVSERDQWKSFSADGLCVTLIDSNGFVDVGTD